MRARTGARRSSASRAEADRGLEAVLNFLNRTGNMPRIDRQESEALEFKKQWADRALEDLAAFANAAGGTLCIGVAGDDQVVGVEADDRELQGFSQKSLNSGARGRLETSRSVGSRACPNRPSRTGRVVFG